MTGEPSAVSARGEVALRVGVGSREKLLNHWPW